MFARIFATALVGVSLLVASTASAASPATVGFLVCNDLKPGVTVEEVKALVGKPFGKSGAYVVTSVSQEGCKPNQVKMDINKK